MPGKNGINGTALNIDFAGLNYESYRNNYFKELENDVLLAAGSAGVSTIHDDGDGNPTIGYGYNLTNRTLEVNTAYFTEAFGTLSPTQINALQKLEAWRIGTETLVNGALRTLTSQDIINGAAGTIPELVDLQSLTMTEAQATALLEAFLEGIPDTSYHGTESLLSSALGTHNIDPSVERIALLSMYYNGPGLIDQPLTGR